MDSLCSLSWLGTGDSSASASRVSGIRRLYRQALRRHGSLMRTLVTQSDSCHQRCVTMETGNRYREIKCSFRLPEMVSCVGGSPALGSEGWCDIMQDSSLNITYIVFFLILFVSLCVHACACAYVRYFGGVVAGVVFVWSCFDFRFVFRQSLRLPR